MSVKITVNHDDTEMVELYSIDKRGKKMLWCVAHSDILGELGIDQAELENASEIELAAGVAP